MDDILNGDTRDETGVGVRQASLGLRFFVTLACCSWSLREGKGGKGRRGGEGKGRGKRGWGRQWRKGGVEVTLLILH